MSKERSDKIRYALVGGGPFTQRRVLPAFEHALDTELAAIISADDQKRNVLGRRHGVRVTGGYEDLERVIEASGARALYLAAPCVEHRALTERAARAGVHVLCDTPMAPTVDEATAMLEACKTAKVRLMMAYRWHFDDASLDAVALAGGGQLGAPRLFTSLLTRPQRTGGGRAPAKLANFALWELAGHPIHAARHLFGAEPVRVFAAVARGELWLADVGATLSATLIFADDRFAQFSVSVAASAPASYRLIGEKGHLLVEAAYADDEPSTHVLSIGSNSVERQFPAHRGSVARQLSAFSRAIRENIEIEPSGHEGLADVRVLEALIESQRTRQSVDLSRHSRLGRSACS
jgi:predicted dehydrogenase